tara:strand:+ start:141 stop:431 length:291 start_codon:yes stop_codon:yes gene_type:complete
MTTVKEQKKQAKMKQEAEEEENRLEFNEREREMEKIVEAAGLDWGIIRAKIVKKTLIMADKEGGIYKKAGLKHIWRTMMNRREMAWNMVKAEEEGL